MQWSASDPVLRSKILQNGGISKIIASHCCIYLKSDYTTDHIEMPTSIRQRQNQFSIRIVEEDLNIADSNVDFILNLLRLSVYLYTFRVSSTGHFDTITGE